MRVPAIVLAIALAGCFGVPPGGAQFGDTVTLEYVALDPDTGALLESRLRDVATSTIDDETHYATQGLRAAVMARLGSVAPALAAVMGEQTTPKLAFDRALEAHGLLMRFALPAQFELGAGASPLGVAGERGVVGLVPNQTRSIATSADDAAGYSGTQAVPRTIPGGDFVQEIPRNEFQFFFNPQPSVGLVFEYNILHEARVESLTDTSVGIRVLAEEGQAAPAEFVGVTIVTHVTDVGYSYELVPDVGKQFIIQQPAQGQTPLGLPPGGYRTRGVVGDEVVYDYTTVPTTLAGRDVRFVVALVSVETAVDAVPTGDYGQRRSPVLAGHAHEDDPVDDGHDDHTH